MSGKQRSELISCIFAGSRLRDAFPRGGFAASVYLVENSFPPTQKLRGGFGKYINEEKKNITEETKYSTAVLCICVSIFPRTGFIYVHTTRTGVRASFPPSFAGSQREFEKLPSSRPKFRPPPSQPAPGAGSAGQRDGGHPSAAAGLGRLLLQRAGCGDGRERRLG